jgi:hypothetical protein
MPLPLLITWKAGVTEPAAQVERGAGGGACLHEVAMLGVELRALVLGDVPRAAAVAFVDERFLVRPRLAVELKRPAVVLVCLANLCLDFGRPAFGVYVVIRLGRLNRQHGNQGGSSDRHCPQHEALHLFLRWIGHRPRDTGRAQNRRHWRVAQKRSVSLVGRTRIHASFERPNARALRVRQATPARRPRRVQ